MSFFCEQQEEESSLVLQADRIIIPRLSKPYPMVVRMDLIGTAEARQQEVQFLTKVKAPELLSFLNAAWRDLHELTVLLRYEVDLAKDNITKVRSRILLDEVMPQVKEHKISARDIRDAMVEGNTEVQNADNRLHELNCVYELLKGKLKAFENSYTSAKKLIGENSYNYSTSVPGDQDVAIGHGGLPNNMSRVAARIPITPTVTEDTPGFGNPRY